MGSDAATYMSHAEDDLANARDMSSGERRHTNGRAFHSQQAAEKAVKALLMSHGITPEWTLDIESVAEELPSGVQVGASGSDLCWLSGFAGYGRYGETPVSKSDADHALDIADGVVSTVRGQIT